MSYTVSFIPLLDIYKDNAIIVEKLDPIFDTFKENMIKKIGIFYGLEKIKITDVEYNIDEDEFKIMDQETFNCFLKSNNKVVFVYFI